MMKTHISLFFGVFLVMALSNAIVPILPSYAGSSFMQGAIYAAYFFGAFMSTLPAGILSDRFGRAMMIRSGLALTVISGILLSVFMSPVPVLGARFLEGTGAGFFLAAAMSYVNSVPDHERMSGYFFALMNAGLVIGLVVAGWLGAHFVNPAAATLLFASLTIIPAGSSFFMRDMPVSQKKTDYSDLARFMKEYRWLWYSGVILIGITGVVTFLYPRFSGVSSDVIGVWISGMSIATIGSVLVASRLTLPPVPTIRWCAFLMAAGVGISFFSPLGFVVLGVLAGIVMIAQMAFLAVVTDHQGVAMGLFTTSSYLGMVALPVMAGLIADVTGFFSAFCATAVLALTVAFTIGRCACSFGTSQ
jgi:MFS family permease